MGDRLVSMTTRKKSEPSATTTTTSSTKKASCRLRIAVVGSEGTGKSCLIKRYCEKRFVPRYSPTIGVDYGATKIHVDKREVSVHIFDTSGSPVFAEVRNEFYRDMHGIILAFDAGRRSSFDELGEWSREIAVHLAAEGRDFEQTVVVVCCNKCDLKTTRQVDEVEARLWAEMRGLTMFETSAFSGQGITDMFQAFFSQIVKVHDAGGNGILRTPSSARKVRASMIGGGAAVPPSLNLSSQQLSKQQQQKQLPSTEQAQVMARLRSGKDPWQQMGLSVGCAKEDVNKVYRRLAMLLHPDKTAVQGADEAFKVLGMARKSILGNLLK